MSIKKILTIFLLGLAFNLIWEFLHARLYLHYQNEAITAFILIRAALFDAAFITAVIFIVERWPLLKKNANLWLMILGFIMAWVIEIHALSTSRWAYKEIMPLVPLVNIGLSPAVQLAILSITTHQITKKLK